MTLKPICVPCQRFFRCTQTGFYFTEGMPAVPLAPPGTAEPEKWKPYKIWAGDKYECQGCGAVILSGFGQRPIRLHHEEDFATVAMALQADEFQVNDC
jgi:hypothetical protein